MTDLLPCPFCGGKMENRGCCAIHAGLEICPIHDLAITVGAWNTRATREEWAARAMAAEAEVERLKGCLKKANCQVEHFERQYYLVKDACEAAQAVTVKPLEWVDASSENKWVNSANSPYGEYYIGIDGGSHQALLEANEKPYQRFIGKPVGTLQEAKAAAQADYEARILSAITARPEAEVRNEGFALGWNAAIEAAIDACADYPLVSPDENEWHHYDDQITHSQACIRALHTPAIWAAAKGGEK